MPGTPNVIVENMPGAGSLVAANHVSRAAPKDGTVVAHTEGGLVLQQMFGLNGVEFDARRWQVLGVPAADTNLCVATRASGIRGIAEVMNPGGKPLVIGSYAPGSALWDVPMRLRAALDLNLRLVEGYDGTAKIRLAMDQGEVDGICGWSWESVKATALDRVESGDWTVIVQGTERAAAELPTVPVALDLARDEPARQLIRLASSSPTRSCASSSSRPKCRPSGPTRCARPSRRLWTMRNSARRPRARSSTWRRSPARRRSA